MNPTKSKIELSRNHERSLEALVRHLHTVLFSVREIVGNWDDSEFREYATSLASAEKSEFLKMLDDLEQGLLDYSKELGLFPDGVPRIDSKQALRAILALALVEIDENDPKHLTGYGELSESQVEAITSENSVLYQKIENLKRVIAIPAEKETSHDHATNL